VKVEMSKYVLKTRKRYKEIAEQIAAFIVGSVSIGTTFVVAFFPHLTGVAMAVYAVTILLSLLTVFVSKLNNAATMVVAIVALIVNLIISVPYITLLRGAAGAKKYAKAKIRLTIRILMTII